MAEKKLQSIAIWTENLNFSNANEYSFYLCKGLTQLGLQVHLYARTGNMEKKFQELNIQIHTDSPLNHLLDIFRLYHITNEMKKNQVHLIHIQKSSQLPHALKIAKKLNVPAVLTTYETQEELPLKEKDFQYLKSIIAVNEEVRQYLVNQLHIPRDIIRVIPIGVDIQGATPVKKYEQNQTVVVGTIASQENGMPEFLNAIANVCQKFPDTHFLIAGEWKNKSNLTQLAKKIHITNQLTLVDKVHHNFSILRLLDIYVSIPAADKFGQDILDAMACGKAVVAATIGSHLSLIKDYETGILVDTKNVQDLSNAILQLVENQSLRKKLGENSKTFVAKHFSLETMAEETTLLYEKILNEMNHE